MSLLIIVIAIISAFIIIIMHISFIIISTGIANISIESLFIAATQDISIYLLKAFGVLLQIKNIILFHRGYSISKLRCRISRR